MASPLLDTAGAQPCGTGHFCALRRYFSLMCIKHTVLEMPC